MTPSIAVALGIVTILSVQGFGFLLPGELRMYRELRSATPDPSVIAAIGQQNTMLGGIQGFFQLLLILDMVYLRDGGFCSIQGEERITQTGHPVCSGARWAAVNADEPRRNVVRGMSER